MLDLVNAYLIKRHYFLGNMRKNKEKKKTKKQKN